MDTLGDDELAGLPPSLADRIKEVVDALRAASDASEKSAEQLTGQLERMVEREQALQEKLDEIHEQRQRLTERLFRLEEEHSGCTRKTTLLERDLEALRQEKVHCEHRAADLRQEISGLEGNLQSKLKEIERLSSENCAFRMRHVDAEVHQVERQAMEERFAGQSKEFDQLKLWYEQQLASKEQCVQNLRALYDQSTAKWSDELDDWRQRCDQMQQRIDELTACRDRLTAHTGELAENLKTAQQHYRLLEEAGKQESLEMQNKLVALEKALVDRSAEVTELEQQVGQFAGQSDCFTKTIEERDKEIATLRERLRSQMVRTASVEEPSAPTAKKQKGLQSKEKTLTAPQSDDSSPQQVTKLELDMQCLRDKCSQFVNTIEKKTAVVLALKTDRDEAMRLAETVGKKLEMAEQEKSSLIARYEMRTTELEFAHAELQRIRQANADLSCQVQHLLKTTSPCGDSSSAPVEGSAVGGEADDLVVFNGVAELQKQNERLLSALREAAINRDRLVKEATEKECHDVLTRFQSLTKEVASARDISVKTKVLLESTCQQRNMYKSMCQELMRKTEQKAVADVGSETPVVQCASDNGETLRKQAVRVQLLENETCHLRITCTNLEGQVEGLRLELSQYKLCKERLKQRNALLETKLRDLSQQNARSVEQVDALRTSLRTEQKAKAALLAERRILRRKLSYAEIGIDRMDYELSVVRNNDYQMQRFVSVIEELNSQLEVQRTAAAIAENVQEERDRLMATIDRLEREHREELSKRSTEVENLRLDLEDKQCRLDNVTKQLEWYTSRVGELEGTVERQTEELRTLSSQLCNVDEADKVDVAKLRVRLNLAEIRRERCEEELNGCKVRMGRLEDDLENAVSRCTLLESALHNSKDYMVRERQRMDDELEERKANFEQSLMAAASAKESSEAQALALKAQLDDLVAREKELKDLVEALRRESEEQTALAVQRLEELSSLKRSQDYWASRPEGGSDVALVKVLEEKAEASGLKSLALMAELRMVQSKYRLAEASAADWKKRAEDMRVRLRRVIADTTRQQTASSNQEESRVAGDVLADLVTMVVAHDVCASLANDARADVVRCERDLEALRRGLEALDARLKVAVSASSAVVAEKGIQFEMTDDEFAEIQADAHVQRVVAGMETMHLKKRVFECSVIIETLCGWIRSLRVNNAELEKLMSAKVAKIQADQEELGRARAEIEELKRSRQELQASVESLNDRLECMAAEQQRKAFNVTEALRRRSVVTPRTPQLLTNVRQILKSAQAGTVSSSVKCRPDQSSAISSGVGEPSLLPESQGTVSDSNVDMISSSFVDESGSAPSARAVSPNQVSTTADGVASTVDDGLVDVGLRSQVESSDEPESSGQEAMDTTGTIVSLDVAVPQADSSSVQPDRVVEECSEAGSSDLTATVGRQPIVWDLRGSTEGQRTIVRGRSFSSRSRRGRSRGRSSGVP